MADKYAEIRAEIAALESKLSADEEKPKDEEVKAQVAESEKELKEDEKKADDPIVEDESLEAQFDLPPLDEDVDACMGCTGSDDDDSSEEVPAVTAAEVEEEITQDKFTEVEDEVDAEVPTEEIKNARLRNLKEASARLDRVANYLEKHGRKALAYRIDKLADAVDAEIQKI